MQNVRFNLNELISYLKKPSVATLIDEEYSIDIDADGTKYETLYQQWKYIEFSDYNDRLILLRNNFKNEFINNSYNVVFNLKKYCEDALREFNEIKSKYTFINICGVDVKLSTDFKIKYLDYFQNIGDPNDGGYSQPVEIILPRDKYNELQKSILKRISVHFSFQERIIEDLLYYVNNYNKPLKKRKYNSDYRYNYFKFDKSKIGNRLSPDECIKSFFTSLKEKGFIGGNDPLNDLSNYFKDEDSVSKVIWNYKEADLYYLIHELNKRQYIKDAEGSITNVIPKIFLLKDGSEITSEMLHSRHPSKKVTLELDKIIRLLKH